MKHPLVPVLSSLAVIFFFACGDSTSSNDDNDDRSSIAGSSSMSAENGDQSSQVEEGSSSSLAPEELGELADTSSTGELPVFANCGPRDTTISEDAYIKLECSLNIHPAKGKSVSIKASANSSEIPDSWNFTYSFCGQKLNSTQESREETFTEQTSDRLSVTVMPPTVGSLTINIVVADSRNEANSLTVPFRVTRQ